jgi:hypothetical protein
LLCLARSWAYRETSRVSATSVVDVKDLRAFADKTTAIVFELPLRASGAAFPADKSQAPFCVNKTLAPQPAQLEVGGGVRVLLAKFSRSFETTRTDFKRGRPFDETILPPR